MKQKMDVHKRGRYFTIFDAFPLLFALAIGAFAADYIEQKYGVLLSIAGFIIVSVIVFFPLLYVAAGISALVAWGYRKKLGKK